MTSLFQNSISRNDTFEKDLKVFCKKQKTFAADLKYSEKLIIEKFINNEDFTTSGKIHRITTFNSESSAEVWKIEAMCQGLRPSQWPRIWFLIYNGSIVFLRLNFHANNYDDNAMELSSVKIAAELLAS